MKLENCITPVAETSTNFIFVTPSEVIEYLYCPRYIYYMNVLKIKQHEHKRNLVKKGRNMHELKLVRNKEYLRKKIGAIKKEVDVYLRATNLHLVGRIDEVLFLNDGTAAPLDYKYAFWEEKIYKTLKTQQVLYAMLIEENYNIEVNHAFLVYIRSKNHLEEIKITSRMKTNAKAIVHEIFEVINLNYFPNRTKNSMKCSDCTYKNLCGI